MKVYSANLPSVGEYVFVKVMQITDMQSVQCMLPMYNNIEAFIMPSETTKNKYQRQNKIFYTGVKLVCIVIAVDPEKKYINLSWNKVSPKDSRINAKILTCSEKGYNLCTILYDMYKKFHSIDVSIELDDQIKNNIMRATLWNITDKKKQNKNLYDYILQNINMLLNYDSLNESVSSDFISYAFQEFTRKTVIEPYCIEIFFSLHVICKEGINNLKQILSEVFGNSSNGKFNVELYSPPHYRVTFNVMDYDEMNQTISLIANNLVTASTNYNGIYSFDPSIYRIYDKLEKKDKKDKDETLRMYLYNSIIDSDDDDNDDDDNDDDNNDDNNIGNVSYKVKKVHTKVKDIEKVQFDHLALVKYDKFANKIFKEKSVTFNKHL